MSVGARWLLGIALGGWLLVALAMWRVWPVLSQLADPNRPRSFYIPSQSMLPTLAVNDRVRPRLLGPDEPRRGQVIMFQGENSVRIGRVVAVGGDRVALHGGQVWLDDRPVPLHDVGAGPVIEGVATRLQRERLPGEGGSHLVADAGPSPGDDFGPVSVPPQTLFVLGDDRDRAADSRFPREVEGAGLVPTRAVMGVVDRLLWRPGLRDLGRPVDAGADR